MSTSPPPSSLRRAAGLILLAFALGFLGVAMGWGQGHFLVSAYHHAGI